MVDQLKTNYYYNIEKSDSYPPKLLICTTLNI